MLESLLQQIHYIKFFLLCFWHELGAHVENYALAPLVKIFDPVQKGYDEVPVDLDSSLVSQDLVAGLDGVDDDERVVILDQSIKILDKVSLFELTFA